MSKILKDAKGWLKEVDESACFCEMGGHPYHTLECVKTTAQIIRELVEVLELAEQKLAQQSVQSDGDAPRCEGCGTVPIMFSRYCHVCGRSRLTQD